MKNKTYVVSNPSEFDYAKLAEQLPNIQSEIERHILAASSLVGKLPPLDLLKRVFFILQDEKEDEIILRMLYYIQCLIVSIPPDEHGYIELTDELWNEFASHIEKMYRNLILYLILEGGERKAEGHFTDLDSESFFFKAKLAWCFITGKRHINHLKTYLEPLLSPHDDIFRSLFGMGTIDFVIEIDKIIAALTTDMAKAFDIVKLVQKIFLQHGQINSDTEFNIPEHLAEEMRNESGKASGLDLFDISMVTNLPSNLLDGLSLSPGEDKSFFSDGQFKGSPLRLLPIWNKPFLKVDGKYYCFNISLLSDQIYRAVEKMLRQLQPDYSKLWNERQKAVSENLPFEIFEKLLPGAIFHKNIYYKWQPGQWAECDGLIIYDDHLFIIEIKAGAFTYTPPATDATAYLKSIHKLLFKPVEQGQRFLTYLNSADEVCIYSDENSKSLISKITHQQFRQITLCGITIDQLTQLAANFNQLKTTMNEVTVANVWNVSIDDLFVYADILQNPLQFLHFIEMRHKAFNIVLEDELDHLGLYLQHNDYAKLESSLKSEKNAFILFSGYTQKIDNYYTSLLQFSVDKNVEIELPQQELSPILQQILSLLVKTKKAGRAKVASILLGCDGETRKQFAIQCYQSLAHTRKTQRLMPFHLRGVQIIVFCSYHYPDIDEHTGFIIHALASMQLTNEQENLLLELYFNEEDELLNVDFCFLTTQDIEKYGKEQVHEKMKELGCKRVERRLQQGKIGRNEPCPCGSGKKYKHCHYSNKTLNLTTAKKPNV